MADEQSNIAQYEFESASTTATDLLVLKIEGEESLSQLFKYRLLLCGEIDVDPDQIVGRSGRITVFMNPNDTGGAHPDDSRVARYVSAIVSRFEHVGDGNRFSYYEAELSPIFWLLTFREKCRIFQKLSTKEIVAKVLTDAGIPAQMFQFNLSGSYPQREFCVQYRESEWNFVQRLLEEEGIFYFFKHNKDGHVLIMGDSPQVSPAIVGDPNVPYRTRSSMVTTEHVMEFRLGQEIRTGKVTLRDFEFSKPVPAVEANAKGEKNPELEHYDYPGQYVSGDKKLQAETQRLSKVRLEAFQSTRNRGQGVAICRRFVVGNKFKLIDHSRAASNQEYLLTRMRITGFQPQSAQEEFAGELSGAGPNYMNEFECIPYAVPFRPPRVTPRPVVQGTQTAIVVGPSGEEIYTDENGRVKVHFHWDREGKFDESASCWIRVSQGLAGGQYGSIFLPRIGQEVIIDFLEGDPDQPIITGRVYNGDHMPPYALPGEKTKSTIRSNSSKGSGGANELRFEDKKGSEQVFLHAEKDLHIRAKGSRVETIQGSSSEAVGGEYREKVEKDRSRTVKGNEAISIEGTQSVHVSQDVSYDFSANHAEEAGGNYGLKAINVKIEASSTIELVAGGSSIVLTPGAIFINGPMVNINSGSGPPAPPAGGQCVAPALPASANTETPGHDIAYSGTGQTVEPITPPPPIGPGGGGTTPTDEDSWIKISLKTREGEPVPGEAYRVTTSDNRVIEGRLDVHGEADIEGIKRGQCQITFPDRDKDEWSDA